MRTLCYGGSFNPIHLAHLACSKAAAMTAGFGRVLLIPAAVPPHKPDHADMPPVSIRLKMCELAVNDDPFFVVSDIEARREGPSFTIDTVRLLKAQGWDRVGWLLGADQLRDLLKWKEPHAVIEEADVLIMARPGVEMDWAALPEPFRKLRANVVEAPLIDVSSTDVRRRIKMGLPIDGLVPAPVVRFIADCQLYRDRPDRTAKP